MTVEDGGAFIEISSSETVDLIGVRGLCLRIGSEAVVGGVSSAAGSVSAVDEVPVDGVTLCDANRAAACASVIDLIVC